MFVVVWSCILLFVRNICVSPRQANVTPGLLCTGDIRRRRKMETVSVTPSGNNLHMHRFISGLLSLKLLLEIKSADDVEYLKGRAECSSNTFM